MYVKTTSLSHKIEKEEFDEYVDKKLGKSNRLLKVFDNTEEDDERFDLAENYQKVAKVYHYKDDYVAVTRIINRTTGKVVKLQPVLNKLVLITEQRAFELQQNDYADRFSVFASTQSKGMDSIENEVEQKVEEFEELKTTIDRFRMLLEYSESTSKENLENFLELIPGKYKDYYTIVGPEIIKACGCDESKIKKKWRESLSNSVVEDDVVSEIYKMFKVGQRYTKVDIKNALNNLYERKGYQKKAKATDLELYYLMKPILTPDKKHGFELIGKR